MELKTLIGIGLVLCSNAVAAISQILLKKAAKRTYLVWWRAYVNVFVIAAYSMFVMTTVFSVIALKFIPLSLSAAFAASGQIFVPVLSWLFLKEKISSRRRFGMLIIVLGIIIFSL